MLRTKFTVEVVVETDLDPAEHERRVTWAKSAQLRASEYLKDATIICFVEGEDGQIIALSSGGLREPGPETQELLRTLGQELKSDAR